MPRQLFLAELSGWASQPSLDWHLFSDTRYSVNQLAHTIEPTPNAPSPSITQPNRKD